MNEKYVYADVPRTGLCNMLFPWARATLYARDHQLPMIAPEWVKLGRIGPWLRGETDKRYYIGQFTNAGYVRGVKRWWALYVSRNVRVFSGMGGYFQDLKGESAFLKRALLSIAAPSVMDALGGLPRSFIGVHIRRGDFATIGLSLDSDYYLQAIRRARERVGKLPICVFSDARPDELQYLSEFDDCHVMGKAPALQDLLSLARASILVATNRSTFSSWAAFLGGMPSIWSKSGEPPSDMLTRTEVL